MHHIHLAVIRLGIATIILAASLLPTGCGKKAETSIDTEAVTPANTADALPSPVSLCLLAAERQEGEKRANFYYWTAEFMANAGYQASAREILAEAQVATEMLAGGKMARDLRRIAKSMAKAGDRAGALAIAEKLEGKDTADALSGIAFVFAEAGDKAGAFATAKKLEGYKKANTFGHIAAKMIRAGDKDVANEFLAEARKEVQTLDIQLQPELLTGIARALAKAGDKVSARELYVQAFAVAEKEKEDELWHDLFFNIAYGLAETGDPVNALAVAESKKPEPKDKLLSRISVAMAEAGNTAGAIGIAEKLKGDEKANSLHRIAWVMVKAGDKAGALAVAEKLEGYQKDKALSTIAVAMAESGNTAGAIAIAEKLEGKDKADTLSDIAEAMAEAGNTAGAKEVFPKAIAAAEKLEDDDKAYALRKIVEALTNAGDRAGAKETFSKVLAVAEKLEGYQKAETLSTIAVAMAKSGNTAEVLTVAEKLAGKAKTDALLRIAFNISYKWQSGVNDGDKKRFTEKAIAAAELLKGEDKAEYLQNIAQSMAKAGDKAGALGISEMLDVERRFFTLGFIAWMIATEAVKDAKGEVVWDDNRQEKRKMRQSFAPEDKPLVARIVALLK